MNSLLTLQEIIKQIQSIRVCWSITYTINVYLELEYVDALYLNYAFPKAKTRLRINAHDDCNKLYVLLFEANKFPRL